MGSSCVKSQEMPPPPNPGQNKNDAKNIKPATVPTSGELETNQLKHSKVIFMGNPNVGKTSIISSFMEGNVQKNKEPVGNTNLLQDYRKLINVDEHRV